MNQPSFPLASSRTESIHPIVESTLHEATSDREAEQDENNILSEASATGDPNLYRKYIFSFFPPSLTLYQRHILCSLYVVKTHPITEGHMHVSDTLSIDSRTRVNSRYLREMTLGRFIIKYENITQLDNIGQGI